MSGASDTQKIELYDLEAYPAESHNVAGEQAEKVAELQALLKAAGERDRDARVED